MIDSLPSAELRRLALRTASSAAPLRVLRVGEVQGTIAWIIPSDDCELGVLERRAREAPELVRVEGAGGVGLRRLVREALRMRPDRLVLGECRGEEVADLLSALNTGHDGGAGTLHANSLDDVPARMEALGALAGLDDIAVARQTVSAIGMIVHLDRSGDRRRVAGFGRFTTTADGRLAVVPYA